MNLGAELDLAVGRAIDGLAIARDQSTVNRMVAGSNPARGAKEIKDLRSVWIGVLQVPF
jgi:hypothetical protein